MRTAGHGDALDAHGLAEEGVGIGEDLAHLVQFLAGHALAVDLLAGQGRARRQQEEHRNQKYSSNPHVSLPS